MASFDDLRRAALALPEVHEVIYKGEPWLQVGKKSFALQSRGRVIMKLERGHQDLLFEARPSTFQPCRVGTGGVWSYVALEDLETDELAALVREAWSMIVPKKLSRPVLAAARP